MFAIDWAHIKPLVKALTYYNQSHPYYIAKKVKKKSFVDKLVSGLGVPSGSSLSPLLRFWSPKMKMDTTSFCPLLSTSLYPVYQKLTCTKTSKSMSVWMLIGLVWAVFERTDSTTAMGVRMAERESELMDSWIQQEKGSRASCSHKAHENTKRNEVSCLRRNTKTRQSLRVLIKAIRNNAPKWPFLAVLRHLLA